jgi:type IV secretory pathway VirB6-like protein
MLDDVTDAAEDLSNTKANYLASWIMYQNEDGMFTFDDLKKYADTRGQNFCTDFKCSVASVVNSAIEKALDGFDMLCCGGFPITRFQAVGILKLMFRLRGLTHEWKMSRYS